MSGGYRYRACSSMWMERSDKGHLAHVRGVQVWGVKQYVDVEVGQRSSSPCQVGADTGRVSVCGCRGRTKVT